MHVHAHVGVHVAVGEYMNDPTATFGCPISLARGSNASIQKPRHQCKVVGAIDYSLASAATSSLAAPCTNRPPSAAVPEMRARDRLVLDGAALQRQALEVVDRDAARASDGSGAWQARARARVAAPHQEEGEQRVWRRGVLSEGEGPEDAVRCAQRKDACAVRARKADEACVEGATNPCERANAVFSV